MICFPTFSAVYDPSSPRTMKQIYAATASETLARDIPYSCKPTGITFMFLGGAALLFFWLIKR